MIYKPFDPELTAKAGLASIYLIWGIFYMFQGYGFKAIIWPWILSGIMAEKIIARIKWSR